jgi:hypothetical protein
MNDDDNRLNHPGREDREQVIIPYGTGTAAHRELYGALMKGFGAHEQGALENVMIDNIERLRDDGDSYAP